MLLSWPLCAPSVPQACHPVTPSKAPATWRRSTWQRQLCLAAPVALAVQRLLVKRRAKGEEEALLRCGNVQNIKDCLHIPIVFLKILHFRCVTSAAFPSEVGRGPREALQRVARRSCARCSTTHWRRDENPRSFGGRKGINPVRVGWCLVLVWKSFKFRVCWLLVFKSSELTTFADHREDCPFGDPAKTWIPQPHGEHPIVSAHGKERRASGILQQGMYLVKD